MGGDDPHDIVQIRITLQDIEPPVWRRVQVPTDFPLRRLHDVIQAVMGWLDHHLHQFPKTPLAADILAFPAGAAYRLRHAHDRPFLV